MTMTHSKNSECSPFFLEGIGNMKTQIIFPICNAAHLLTFNGSNQSQHQRFIQSKSFDIHICIGKKC